MGENLYLWLVHGSPHFVLHRQATKPNLCVYIITSGGYASKDLNPQSPVSFHPPPMAKHRLGWGERESALVVWIPSQHTHPSACDQVPASGRIPSAFGEF